MGKLDELLKSSKTIAAESMGAGRAGSTQPAMPLTAPATPERLQGVTRSRSAAEIALDKIIRDPGQPREEFDPDALERLAISLKTRGQLQPVMVRWDESASRYMIVVGERRWRAAQLAGLTTLSCVILDKAIGADDLLSLQLVENCLREDLSALEQARAFRTLMTSNNWSTRDVARELAVAQPSVVRALALLELPDEVQLHVDSGALPPATAYEISKVDDPDTIRAVAQEVVNSGLNRAETMERVREVKAARSSGKAAKSRGAARPKALKSRAIRIAAGKVTIDLRKPGTDSDFLAALDDAAASLRRELSTEITDAA